jgi:starch synthase
MRVLYVTSEVSPFAKSGRPADVSACVTRALHELGIDIRLLVPGYRVALDRASALKEVVHLGDPLNCGPVRLLESALPQTGVPVWFVDCPTLYDRAGGLYRSEKGVDWPDNAIRFALLNHVAAGIANEPGRSWRPDLVHCNDWQAALVPLLLAGQACPRPSLLTIHNPAAQGHFPAHILSQLDLPAEAQAAMAFDDRFSFLKSGLHLADAIITIKPHRAFVPLAFTSGDDLSWKRSALVYARLYRSLTRLRNAGHREPIVVETGEPEKLTA